GQARKDCCLYTIHRWANTGARDFQLQAASRACDHSHGLGGADGVGDPAFFFFVLFPCPRSASMTPPRCLRSATTAVSLEAIFGLSAVAPTCSRSASEPCPDVAAKFSLTPLN